MLVLRDVCNQLRHRNFTWISQGMITITAFLKQLRFKVLVRRVWIYQWW